MDDQKPQPNGEPEEQPTSPLARLPDHHKLDKWLGVHMARAAKEYDEAVTELRHVHNEARGNMADIKAEMAKLAPLVEAVIDHKVPMSKKAARAWKRLIELEDKLAGERAARHSSAAATYADDDPERPAIGGEIGTSVGEAAKRREGLERWPTDEEAPPEKPPKEGKVEKSMGDRPTLRPDADVRNADWLRPRDPYNEDNLGKKGMQPDGSYILAE